MSINDRRKSSGRLRLETYHRASNIVQPEAGKPGRFCGTAAALFAEGVRDGLRAPVVKGDARGPGEDSVAPPEVTHSIEGERQRREPDLDAFRFLIGWW